MSNYRPVQPSESCGQWQKTHPQCWLRSSADTTQFQFVRHWPTLTRLFPRPWSLLALQFTYVHLTLQWRSVETKPAEPWTLEILANLAGMSRTSFANNFRDALHVSPGKYLENLRLAIARQLVQSGNGLKQIAKQTGYSSPSTLSRALARNV